MLDPHVEVSLKALADPEVADWARRPPGGPWLSPKGRERTLMEARKRHAETFGRERTEVPAEQIRLLEGSPVNPLGAVRRLGLVGEALEFLANRYIALWKGLPTIESEKLLEYQALRTRVFEDQLACWKVARELHQRDPYLTHAPRLDWPVGLTAEDPHLLREISAGQDILHDGHVHLGGVLATADLWRAVLDPRQETRRLLASDPSHDGLWGFRFDPHVRNRLLQAREMRDLLSVNLVASSPEYHFRRFYPLLVPGRRFIESYQSMGPLLWQSFQELKKTSSKKFLLQTRTETAFTAHAGDSLSPLAAGLARENPVPLILSPWFRGSNTVTQGEMDVQREREFLYHAFLALLTREHDLPPWFGPVLATYLVCQNLFHGQVTQHRARRGLGNFLEWYDAPAREVGHEDPAAWQSRVYNRITNGGRIRVEGRLTPSTARARTWIDTFHRNSPDEARIGVDFGLVVHFIKSPDSREKEPDGGSAAWFDRTMFLRHRALRASIRSQALEIEDGRARDVELAWGIVGIDAARNEIDAPPEVFAPAFRYLRRNQVPGVHGDNAEPRDWAPPLRATFHAGESFHHPMSGLRTIHEAIRFLNLGPGDRLGHGIVLGLDARSWVANCEPLHELTREERFDDLVWMAELLRGKPDWTPIEPLFERILFREFQALYPRANVPRPHALLDLLVHAWELRWMDPEHLFPVLKAVGCPGIEGAIGGSSRHTHVKRTTPCSGTSCPSVKGPLEDIFRGYLMDCGKERRCPMINQRWKTGDFACRSRGWAFCRAIRDMNLSESLLVWRLCTVDFDRLFSGEIPLASLALLQQHHFSREHRKVGEEKVQWDESIPWIDLFPLLQDTVMKEAAERHLTIECCPSSNVSIGGLSDVTSHPIFRFDSSRLGAEGHQRIRATVNTDDPGIFSTNLPNEYMLLAQAALERGHDHAEVSSWIRHLKREARRATFLHETVPEIWPRLPPDAWPPALTLHPEWLEAPWRKLVFNRDQQARSLRLLDRLRRGLFR